MYTYIHASAPAGTVPPGMSVTSGERPTFYPSGSFYDKWKRDRIRNTRHATSEEKGIPVPHTGHSGGYRTSNGMGVSSGSHVLSHYYADEGAKGQWVRRKVRRIETRMWVAEWSEEYYSDTDAYDASEWFSESLVERWEREEADGFYENYDPTVDAPYYGVPYGEWDDYGYMPGESYQGCGDPHCNFWGC